MGGDMTPMEKLKAFKEWLKRRGADQAATEMSDDARKRAEERDRNLEYFMKVLPTIIDQRRGKFVIIRNQRIVGYYDTVLDASYSASKTYPDGNYSMEPVGDTGPMGVLQANRWAQRNRK
jgi:hypothetical protein